MISSTKRSLRRALLSFAAAFAPFAAIAATINVPADQKTIQAGIDAASPGDTVLVAPGTYYENIDFKGKAITVTSGSAATTATTIIDGGNNGPAVTFKSGEPRSAVLSYFTVQNGGNYDTYTGFSGAFAAGGIIIASSAPTILNNIVNHNTCWGIETNGAAPLIQGNTVSATQDPKGGCSFGGGAGIYIGGNQQSSDPAATDGNPALITGNIIENNVESGNEDAGGNGGAGIAVWGGSPAIQNNIIRNNSSPGGTGGAINVVYGGQIAVLQNLIYGNQAGCGGGAISFWGGSLGAGYYILIANNTIVDNTGTTTGGSSDCIAISQIYPFPGTYGDSGPTAAFVNNIISGDTSAPAINCSQIPDFSNPNTEANQPIFDHNIVYNAGGVFFGSLCVDVSAKYGNISADPQFVNAASHDYHLKPTSPAIDAGNNSVLQPLQTLTGSAVTTDFDNNPRLQDFTGKGYPIIDMGAYEYAGKVDATDTTVVLTSSAYAGSAGSNFTLTATLASALGNPTGFIDFFLDGKQIGVSTIDSNGIATLTNFLLAPGVHNLYAKYAGAGSFTPATSVIIIVNIDPYISNLSATSLPNPSLLGQNVTFTIKASSADPSYVPSPIKLTDTSNNYAVLATLVPDSSGIATYSTSTLALGYHFIAVDYFGDSTHAGFDAGVTQQVINGYTTSTALTSSLNPSNAGQPVTFTATVTSANGTPTGLVTFTDGTTTLGTQNLVNGVATFTTASLAIGTHPITAAYNPTGTTFNASTAMLSQVVNGIATTTTIASSLNPANVAETVTFTANVTFLLNGAPASAPGHVIFYDGTAPISGTVAITNSVATFATSSLTAGSHQIQAQYYPTNAAFTATSATLTQVINGLPTTTSLTVTPTTAVYGTNIFMSSTASASGTAVTGGTITFFDGASSIAVGQQIQGLSPITYNDINLTVGTHIITAVYSGDATHNGSTSAPVTVTITSVVAALSLSATPNPAFAFQPIILTATLAGTSSAKAGSTIVFSAAGTSLTTLGNATTNAQGVATFMVSLPAGGYTLGASFAGNANVSSASAPPVVEVVNSNPTTTTLYAQPNPGYQNSNETLTASIVTGFSSGPIPPIPTGTVTFFDAGAPISTAPLDAKGQATFSSNAFSVGDHTLTAVYNGTANFVTSTTNPYTLAILLRDFTLTAEPTITIQTEHHKSLILTLTSIGNFSDIVALSCGPMPEFASCSFSTNGPVLSAEGTTPAALRIETDAAYNYLASHSPDSQPPAYKRLRDGFAFALLLPVTLFATLRPRSLRALRSRTGLFVALFVFFALVTLTGCSGHYPGHTAPGTYSVTVTGQGVATHVTHTTTITLVVTE